MNDLIYLPLLMALLALSAAAPASAAPRTLATERFANVFVEGQAVQVRVGAGEAVPVVLRDLPGAEVARRDAPAGEGVVDFGPQPPGYYEAAAGETVLPLVVLIDPAKRVPGESRLAADNAMSWLVKPQQFDGVAEVMRLAGLGWVRERLSWGEVEKERGKLTWGRYDTSADALSKRGIKVYQIFHAIPGWARADHDGKAAPDDLRDIYRFAQELARHYQGRVQAYEVWNEPDISFFSHPASECAAFQKAAYLGFKSVDPQLTILGPSMAHGANVFSDSLLANGIAESMDIWNYHIYADPSAYPARHQGFQALLAKHGVTLPSWVTEAGDRVNGPGGVLTRESRVHQAAFASRAYAQALAAGIDKHFWFVFPFYREGETGWGLFEPDQRAPFPGLAAISTATYALGHGDYLGRLSLAAPEARAFAFARGNGTTGLVVWREADAPAEVTLPLEWRQVREARTHVGTPLPAGAGPVRVSVGKAAVFMILDEAALAGKLTDLPAPRAVPSRPTAGLKEAVVRLRVDGARILKDADCYEVGPGEAVALQAEVYNFGKAPLTGELRLSAPQGWKLDRTTIAATVAPGERAVLPVKLTAPEGYESAEVRLTAASGRLQSTPAVVRLRVDANRARAAATRDLGVDDPAKWQKNIAGHGSMEIAAGPDGGVRFVFTFRTNGDNWAYPQTFFNPPLDLSQFNALRFEYRTSVADPGPVRLMLLEEGGAAYFTGNGVPGSTEWRSATVLFSDLQDLGMGTRDTNGKLDTDRITGFRFGANSKPLSLTLEVRGVQAVQL